MLRALFKSDIQQLLGLENAVSVTPWTKETFTMCFDAGYKGWGIELDQILLGFVFISLNQDECHILNLGVAKEYQGQGYGKKLLAAILEMGKKAGATIAYLEVRKTNARAIHLYQKMHFQMIGIRKDYYKSEGGTEDALIYATTL